MSRNNRKQSFAGRLAAQTFAKSVIVACKLPVIGGSGRILRLFSAGRRQNQQQICHSIPHSQPSHLSHFSPVPRFRNLSYGRQNDENKRAIKVAGGTNALVRLLRKTGDNEVKELVTGVLWNLSSCDDLKRTIIDEALLVIVNIVIIPHSGWDRAGAGGETHWSTVFRNASGILRNVSSAGDYGRKKLRECEGLVDSLIYLVRTAIERANIDNKSVENAVCVLR